MEVSLTGDSYVAGEETAMMEAIEGKRSTPRYKPPFPAQAGLFQKPTNINNVKTLAYAPSIVASGGDEFKRIGTESSSGTALVCLTGHIKRPGMYEVAMGMTIRQVLEDIGGGVADGSERIKVLQTGGPLGGVMGEEAFDTEIDFDEMAKSGAILGSGGIIVGDETTDVVDLIRNLVAFNQFESCGKCFPLPVRQYAHARCARPHVQERSAAWRHAVVGNGRQQHEDRLAMRSRQLGYNPISSAISYFGDEFEKTIQRRARKIRSVRRRIDDFAESDATVTHVPNQRQRRLRCPIQSNSRSTVKRSKPSPD